MINLSTPALLFPAISLLLLAYTNRFLALAALVRSLHAQWLEKRESNVRKQIEQLRQRLKLVRNMQALGIASILCCVVAMFLILISQETAAQVLFAASLVLLALSMILSLIEILVSTNSLELQLGDIEAERQNAVSSTNR